MIAAQVSVIEKVPLTTTCSDKAGGSPLDLNRDLKQSRGLARFPTAYWYLPSADQDPALCHLLADALVVVHCLTDRIHCIVEVRSEVTLMILLELL